MKFKSLSLICALVLAGSGTGAYAQVPLENLNLPQAVNLTLTQNSELLSKEAKLQADSEQVNQAKARVLPNIRLTGNYGRGEYRINGVDGVKDRFKRLTVSLVQPLYSQRNFLAIDRAELGVEAAQTQFSLDRDTKILELVQAYLEYLQYSKLYKISQMELEDHQVKVQRLQALLNRGLATKMDMLEANSTYDILHANAVQTENDMRIRKVRLQRLLGNQVNSVEKIDETLWKRTTAILGHRYWLQTAYRNHPALRLAQQQEDMARIDIDSAKAGYLPEIALRAEVSDNDSLETSIERTNKLQIELSMPLYDGGSTSSKVTASRAMVESRQHQLQDRKEFIQVKLEETMARMQGNLAKINALNESIESSKSYLDAAQKGLSYGLRGVFDVLEAKSRVYDARRELTMETYDNLLAQFEFLYLIGRLEPETVQAYLSDGFSVTSLR